MIAMRRRKSFFTLTFLIFCIVYFNWFINVSDWKRQDATSVIHGKDDKSKPDYGAGGSDHLKSSNENFIVYELIEVNDASNDVVKNNGNNFVLLSAAAVVNKQMNNNDNSISEYDLNGRLVLKRNEFKHLIKFLYSQNVFLLDVDLLKEVRFKKSIDASSVNKLSTIDIYDIFKWNQIEQIENYENNKRSSREHHITFGVFLSSFNQLNQNLYKNIINNKCRLIQSYGTYGHETILTSFYIECKYLTIQIAIVYDRSKFLWIGEDNYKSSNGQTIKKLFGDTPRAINSFTLSKLVDEDSNEFYVPSQMKAFLFDYDHSKFIECNRHMAKENIKRMGPSYNQNIKRNKMIAKVTEHISQTLESFEKHYWLAGGTLLGWYRDCGIIPHTQDVDLAIWSHEYETRIKRHFLGNKVVRVWGTLGLINDSYEFRLFNDQFTFDMFLVYNLNNTHQWCGYQVNRVKFRRFLPKFGELCSAELLNQKYMVPCDPVHYLDEEYGPNNWHSPQAKNYSWTNVKYWQNWTDALWPHTIKYYDKHGNLLKPKMLEYINKHLKYNLTQLPADDVR